MAKTCYRGELYYADLGKGVGSEQEGCRPVVILQNDMGNRYSPTTIAAPISCKIDTKAKLPTHYILEPVAGLVRPSVVLLEQVRVIDKHRLERKLGSLPERHIAGIKNQYWLVGLSWFNISMRHLCSEFPKHGCFFFAPHEQVQKRAMYILQNPQGF